MRYQIVYTQDLEKGSLIVLDRMEYFYSQHSTICIPDWMQNRIHWYIDLYIHVWEMDAFLRNKIYYELQHTTTHS